MFTIAQLEPAPAPSDNPYQHPRPTHPQAVSADGQKYNIKRLLNKRVVRKERGIATEYLLRWKGYGPEFNRWYNLKDLQDALKLVDEYEEKARRIGPSKRRSKGTLDLPLRGSTPPAASTSAPPKRPRGRPRKDAGSVVS